MHWQILIAVIIWLNCGRSLAEENTQFAQVDNQAVAAVRLDSTSTISQRDVSYTTTPSHLNIPFHFVAPSRLSSFILVFIGGLDADTETFDRVVELLSPAGYGILQIELNGQGNLISTAALSESISVESQSQDLISVFDQLQIDKTKIILVGESYGAAVALQTATDILSRNHLNVAAIDLINPLIPSSKLLFVPTYMRLKNISGVGPDESRSPHDFLVYLSERGEYAAQSEESFDLNEVTAAYELFSGVSPEICDELLAIKTKVNIFDGLADLVVSSSDKLELYAKIPSQEKGLYVKSEGSSHRASEESPKDVTKFLIDSQP